MDFSFLLTIARNVKDRKQSDFPSIHVHLYKACVFMDNDDKKSVQFYSKFTVYDILKNGAWKSVSMSIIMIVLILFWNNFKIDFTSLNKGTILFLIFLIGPLITSVTFATKEIKILNNDIYYKIMSSSKWKILPISDIDHISFFQKPIERFSIFPKAVIYPKPAKKATILEFLINKQDVYKFLSLVHECNIPVLFFNDLKNIEDTEYYMSGK